MQVSSMPNMVIKDEIGEQVTFFKEFRWERVIVFGCNV